MDCFVGATTGALKTINLRENSFTNLTPIKELLPKRDEITSLTWDNHDEQVRVLAAQVDRQLKLFDGETSHQKPLFTIEGGTGPVKGLHLTDNDKIVSCVESGVVKVWSRVGKECSEWQAGPGVTCMHGSNERKAIVTGGNDHLVKSWDIETGKQTWSARNVALDFLQLPVPIKVTDVRFVNGQTTIVEATKLHELRLYDTRTQRRPIRKMLFLDSPLTAVSLCSREHHVLAANSVGEMGLFDIRSKVHPVYKYKGQAGSIRSIDAHPTEPYVATCGIDRFVRIHHLETRKLIHKIYCKTRMNKIIIRKDLSILTKPKEEEDWDMIKEESESDSDLSDDDEAESDDDISEESDVDVWEELENGSKKQRKRKEPKQEEEEVPEPAKKKKLQQGTKRKEHEEVKEEITISDDEEPKKKSRKEEKPVTKGAKKAKKAAHGSDDSADEEPKKKSKLEPKAKNSANKKGKSVKADVKEEVLSDHDVDPLPVKKRKVTKKSKK